MEAPRPFDKPEPPGFSRAEAGWESPNPSINTAGLDDACEALGAYRAFRDKIDLLTEASWERYQDQMQCKAGCFDCCRGDFHVSLIEGYHLFQTLRRLPQVLLSQFKANLDTASPDTPSRCPLLIDGRCGIYAERPILCRIFGFPVKVAGSAEQAPQVATCELNFTQHQNQVFESHCFDQAAIGQVLNELSKFLSLESRQDTAPASCLDEPALPTYRLADILRAL